MLLLVILGVSFLWLLWGAARLIQTQRYSLPGKVAVITGGSRGLGLVLARAFVAHGTRVILLARHPNELARARADLERRGGEVETIACDLVEEVGRRTALAEIMKRFGRVDILINNAGIIEVGPLQHTTREDFARAMALHFWAPFELTSALTPQMRAAGGGRIVNISSIGGKIAPPHLAAYAASKFALTGYSDSVRTELARDRIYVTTVCPGLMRTGSHLNAKTKGRHDAEFAWFAVAASTPLLSMSAERASRKIIAACRRGQPSLTLTFAARLAVVANALFPNVFAQTMRLANRFLPGPSPIGGDEAQSGWESHSRGAAPTFLTKLSDKAMARNNETPPSTKIE